VNKPIHFFLVNLPALNTAFLELHTRAFDKTCLRLYHTFFIYDKATQILFSLSFDTDAFGYLNWINDHFRRVDIDIANASVLEDCFTVVAKEKPLFEFCF